MCDLNRLNDRLARVAPGPQLPDLPAVPDAENRRPLKVWEIDDSYHCSIIGTCLSMRDLRKISTKARARIPEHYSEHEIHAIFVRSAGRSGLAGRLISKALDRKYRSEIAAAKRLRSVDELRAYWRQARERGDIPGPYWAALSHPLADTRLRAEMFGDVHMLSHLVGAANRADLQRLVALQAENDRFVAAFDAERQRNTRIIAEHEHEIAGLKAKLGDHVDDIRRVDELKQRLQHFENGEALQNLTARLDHATACAETEAQKTATVQALLAERDEAISARNAEFAALNEELAALRREHEALEQFVATGLADVCRHCAAEAPEAAGELAGLSGANIVYVGGRTTQIGHFRALVERAGGQLLHHDGGLEDGIERLEGALARGDVVLCPVDCVSHSACLKAKNHCKRAGKCFVPLRSSGLSAFVAGLREIKRPDQRSSEIPS